MLPIHKILHPTDFSDRAREAFRVACGLAHDYNAELIILHVVAPPSTFYGEGLVPEGPGSDLEEARASLREVVPAGFEVRFRHQIEQGDAVAEIVRVARETGCDLIVMGTQGRTGLDRLLLGSVAEGVLRQAACPVFPVRVPFPTRSQ